MMAGGWGQADQLQPAQNLTPERKIENKKLKLNSWLLNFMAGTWHLGKQNEYKVYTH